MNVLDTDHLSVHAFPDSDSYRSLSARILQSGEEFGTTIVCVEEQLRGWLAYSKRKKDVSDQVMAYDELGKLLDLIECPPIFDRDVAAFEISPLIQSLMKLGQELTIAAEVVVIPVVQAEPSAANGPQSRAGLVDRSRVAPQVGVVVDHESIGVVHRLGDALAVVGSNAIDQIEQGTSIE